MDGRPNCRNKAAFTNISGVVSTLIKTLVSFFYRKWRTNDLVLVQHALATSELISDLLVSLFRFKSNFPSRKPRSKWGNPSATLKELSHGILSYFGEVQNYL